MYRKELAKRIDYMALTQKELSVKIGLSLHSTHKIITGKTKRITHKTALKLCKALDCEAIDILSGRDLRRWQEDIKKISG